MDLFIKQKVFSWGQKFDIFDADGNVIFYCESEIFTVGRKLYVYDINDNEVIYIRQRLLRFMPSYEIYINGQLEATIIKRFAFLKHDFYYQGVDWYIEGKFLAHDYRINCQDQNVATITKRWLTWGDTYDISINENFDTLLALASCIVVDCVCHRDGGVKFG